MDDVGPIGPSSIATMPSDYIRGETLDRIRHFLQGPEKSAYTDLKGMCERVSDSYAPS
jgi:hypothetical protein